MAVSGLALHATFLTDLALHPTFLDGPPKLGSDNFGDVAETEPADLIAVINFCFQVQILKESPSYQEALKSCRIHKSPTIIKTVMTENLGDVYSDIDLRKLRDLNRGSEESWPSSSDGELSEGEARKSSMSVTLTAQQYPGSPKESPLPAVCAITGSAPPGGQRVSFRYPTMTCTTSEDDGEEENTSERSQSSRPPELAMISSGSTMASSLERSLEMAAFRSDGLSDQEQQVRAVKRSILGHRRTFSVSLY